MLKRCLIKLKTNKKKEFKKDLLEKKKRIEEMFERRKEFNKCDEERRKR
jgi:hypothetical protein